MPGTDAEHGARLVVGEPFDISQQDDLALAGRQVVEGGPEDRRPRRGVETLLALVRPPLDGIGPLALGVESGRVDRVQRLHRRRARLPCTGRAGAVDEDGEEPRLERRTSLEPVDARAPGPARCPERPPRPPPGWGRRSGPGGAWAAGSGPPGSRTPPRHPSRSRASISASVSTARQRRARRVRGASPRSTPALADRPLPPTRLALATRSRIEPAKRYGGRRSSVPCNARRTGCGL